MCMCVNMNNTKLSYKNYVVGIMEAREKVNTHNIRVITPRALLCLTKMAGLQSYSSLQKLARWNT